jgi:hypothetical protein
MAVRLPDLRADRALLPRNISFSDTHFSYRLCKPQGLVRPEGLGESIKIFVLVGSRIRDLPVCSAVQRASVASYSYLCSWFTDSSHPDEGGAQFLRNVGS